MTDDFSSSQSLATNNPYGLYFPPQAKQRSYEWRYVGWISNPPSPSASYTFDEFVERAKNRSGIREVDIYEWGAVCWVKE